MTRTRAITPLIATAILLSACSGSATKPDSGLIDRPLPPPKEPRARDKPSLELTEANARDVLCADVIDPETGDSICGCPTGDGLFLSDNAPGVLEIKALHQGHFSEHDADEALVTVTGCVWANLDDTATFLLRRDPEGWKRTWGETGWSVDACAWAKTNEGTQIPICNSVDGSQGYMFGSIWWAEITASTFARREIITYQSNSAACPEESVLDVDAKVLDVRDLDEDGDDDLIVEQLTSRWDIPAEFEDACEAEERDYTPPKPARELIEFTLQGLQFHRALEAPE